MSIVEGRGTLQVLVKWIDLKWTTCGEDNDPDYSDRAMMYGNKYVIADHVTDVEGRKHG